MNRQKTFSVVTSAPTFAVIQGAYEVLCARETEIELRIATEHHELFSPVSVQVWLATEPPIEDWLKFQALVKQWKHERGAMSSITEGSLCPAYQTIIGMGEPVVSFLLTQLEAEGDEPDQWFWALKAITGDDPVPDEDRGNYAKMAVAWFGWAKDQGYAW